MGSTIVVGVDGSDSSRAALTWAAHEARLRDAALQVVTAYRFPLAFAGAGAGSDVAAPIEQREAESIQREMLADVGPALEGLDVSRSVAGGEGPGHAVIKAAAEADLLVVGTTGRGGVSGFTIGSVSHYCVSHAPCPVVVVPEVSRD